MKIDVPDDINILALHRFAQKQGCRIQQATNGGIIMKRVVVKFPGTRALTTQPSLADTLFTMKQAHRLCDEIEQAKHEINPDDGAA